MTTGSTTTQTLDTTGEHTPFSLRKTLLSVATAVKCKRGRQLPSLLLLKFQVLLDMVIISLYGPVVISIVMLETSPLNPKIIWEIFMCFACNTTVCRMCLIRVKMCGICSRLRWCHNHNICENQRFFVFSSFPQKM